LNLATVDTILLNAARQSFLPAERREVLEVAKTEPAALKGAHPEPLSHPASQGR